MITILCSGSRGDIQPYIALAQQLKKLGKAVRITAGNSFEGFIRGYGIDFYPLSADYKTAQVDPKLLKDAQSSDNPLKMLLTFGKMKRYAAYMTEEMYNACAGSELILYHPGCTIGYFAGVILGIPSVLASPFPMHKTRAYASVIAYGRYALPNKFTYALLQGMLWMASKTGVESFLKKHTGRLPKGFGCPFEKVDDTHPAVISCSNFVFPRPEDWRPSIYQKGYWFVEEPDDYIPPQELEAFLAAGDKPVYLGFGSVFRADEKDALVKLMVEALNRCGKRGIIAGMGAINDPSGSIIAVDNVPHTWLFKRMCAVCHHGGAGTTAAGFRAGVPSIIVPFSNDQFAWAHRAYDLGVGSPPVYRKSLSADALAEAIQYALQYQVVQNAARLAANIDMENGAKECAQIVSSLVSAKHDF